jgi:hypothetical protein
MEALFELNPVAPVIAEDMVNTQEFKEFSEALEQMDIIYDASLYLEKADQGVKRGLIGNVKKTVSRTVETTGDLYNAYDDLSSGNSDLIYSMWSVIGRAINLTVKVISYLTRQVAKVPMFISKCLDKVQTIPASVRSKIHGNIELYICSADIAFLYNNGVMRNLDVFISEASLLSQGETWTRVFNGKGLLQKAANKIAGGTPNENDIKLCKKMQSTYNRLKMATFKPTTVEMKDPKMVDMYFGAEKSIKFKDLKGQVHECTYYDALIQMMNDLNERKADLEKIQTAIGGKYNQSLMSNDFAKLSKGYQNLITDSINMVSKGVNFTGNIVKYVMADIKTINGATEKILKKAGKK